MISDSQQRGAVKPQTYTCPGCAANLLFEPQGGCLTCPYCGRKEMIPESAEQVQERSYADYLHPRSDQLKTLSATALEVKCDSCGAVVTFAPPEVAGECSFYQVMVDARTGEVQGDRPYS